MRRDASLCSDDFDDARVALDVLLPAVDDKRVSLVVARWRVGHQRVRALLIVGDVGAVGGDMGGVGRVVLAGTPGTRQTLATLAFPTPCAVLSAFASLPCHISESRYQPSTARSATAKHAMPTTHTTSTRESPLLSARLSMPCSIAQSAGHGPLLLGHNRCHDEQPENGETFDAHRQRLHETSESANLCITTFPPATVKARMRAFTTSI